MKLLVAAFLILSLCLFSTSPANADPMSTKDDAPPSKFTSRLKNALVNESLKETLLVSEMPARVQASWGKDDDHRLANPGDKFCAGCVITPGLARNRLIFAGSLPGDLYVVVWESGGFALMNKMRVYDLSNKSAPLMFESSLPGGVIDSPKALKKWAAKQALEQ